MSVEKYCIFLSCAHTQFRKFPLYSPSFAHAPRSVAHCSGPFPSGFVLIKHHTTVLSGTVGQMVPCTFPSQEADENGEHRTLKQPGNGPTGRALERRKRSSGTAGEGARERTAETPLRPEEVTGAKRGDERPAGKPHGAPGNTVPRKPGKMGTPHHEGRPKDTPPRQGRNQGQGQRPPRRGPLQPSLVHNNEPPWCRPRSGEMPP